MIVFFGGAAGSGKTTVARLWCESRPKSTHIQLDEIRNLIIGSKVDPQVKIKEQSNQYNHSVSACIALAKAYHSDGYDVAIDDVFEPIPTHNIWLPQLSGFDIRLIILYPPLDILLLRAYMRTKQVMEHHIRTQYASISDWPISYRIDNGELTPDQTLGIVVSKLDSVILKQTAL